MSKVGITLLVFLSLATGAGVGTYRALRLHIPPPSNAEIRRALGSGEEAEALQLGQLRLSLVADDPTTLLLMGEASQRSERLDEALKCYGKVSDSAPQEALAARIAAASILLASGKLADAETQINRAALLNPGHPQVDDLKVTLYALTGQRWLSIEPLHRLISRPGPTLTHAIYLANPDEMPVPPEELFARMFSVGDPLGLLGAAHTAGSLGRFDQAYELIDRCLAARPDLPEARILRGTLLLDQGRFDEFSADLAQLTAREQEQPNYWFNRARLAHQHNDFRGAVRCYWETLKRQPNHDRATYQIGQALAALGERTTAEQFLERGQKLRLLVKTAIELFDGLQTDQRFWSCAQLCQQLGRLPESGVWCSLLLERNARHRQARKLLETFQREWPSSPPFLLASHNLAATFPGESYPLPPLQAAVAKSESAEQMQRDIRFLDSAIPRDALASQATATIQFKDVAAATGLQFVYFGGDDPGTEGRRMFEYTGGGVAVIDFDRDGWPDLHFTQGSRQPGDFQQQQYLDGLFRNVQGTNWSNVARDARVSDTGFGQGVSVGDFDHDGFSDLYIANVDGNRLWKNNGDGTFTDVTPTTGLGHDYWTSSCLLADINGDGIVDVYDVTFLTGSDVFDRTCKGPEGRFRSCAPSGFDAAPDQVFLGNGDGTFRLLGLEAGFDVPEGSGLGIVAADFDQSGRLSLFVGNDGRPNFLFVPEPGEGPTERWTETGVLSGVAFDEAGISQACMGIGASDANNDGLTDLFVTNFFQESNTLYMNLGGLAFADRARVSGLREPSLEMLGFGAQFIDADRDGWEDILLVNGHVDDFTFKGIPYQMPAEFFVNRQGRFEELTAAELGPFFGENRLGRSLATLDWNRDGLVDAAISDLQSPAALLTNQTANAGTYLAFRVVGTQRSRDGLGTRVRVTVGAETRERQLTGGDGYQASNEKRLVLGWGQLPAGIKARVEILWPGGQVSQWNNVELNQELLAIEGRELLTMPR